MTIANALTSYVAAFIDELARVDIQDVVISPGSRSTPMAILMAEHPEIRTYVNIDERSAAFFALGMAKAKRKAVAILCTSGTAAANYFPAIIEANYSRVPLIVLTADRPHELRDVGAPQAINQISLFGNYAKWFVEMALPEDRPEMLRYTRTIASRAAGSAQSAPAGPVHLNFPFREPLVPNLTSEDLWKRNQYSPVHVTVGRATLSDEEIDRLATQFKMIEKGLIICGAHDHPDFSNAVTKLAEQLNYPILADPLSQLRSGAHNKDYIIECYDTILRDEQISEQLKPEVIIRFGAMPVSKALFLFIKKYGNCQHIVVDSGGGWRDPSLMASEMIECDENDFCNALVKKITANDSHPKWIQNWVHINHATSSALNQVMDEQCLFEGKIFIELADILPEHSTLFVGNSMPIRDLDTFFPRNEKSIKIMANRGANGIDGVVSSALGASTSASPLVLIIGDLSFFHDLNGLLAAKLLKLTMTIILINNDGGGIFSFLPQAKEKKHFESLFGTPTGLDFEHAVKMYNGVFDRINSWETFRQKVTEGISTKGINVIEVPTCREENVDKHRILWKNVSQEILSEVSRKE